MDVQAIGSNAHGMVKESANASIQIKAASAKYWQKRRLEAHARRTR
jgi:hypothetical protein